MAKSPNKFLWHCNRVNNITIVYFILVNIKFCLLISTSVFICTCIFIISPTMTWYKEVGLLTRIFNLNMLLVVSPGVRDQRLRPYGQQLWCDLEVLASRNTCWVYMLYLVNVTGKNQCQCCEQTTDKQTDKTEKD